MIRYAPAGTSRHRQPPWAGGCAWPVGKAAPAATSPASSLSSQSEQRLVPSPTTQEALAPAARATSSVPSAKTLVT